MMKIDVPKLRYLGTCVDQIVEWATETLQSTSVRIRCWLKSTYEVETSAKPFKQPQELATVKRYKNHFKQLIFYTFRTASLDQDTRDRLYGIRFTAEQKRLIDEICQMLNTNEARRYIASDDDQDSELNDGLEAEDEEDEEDEGAEDENENDMDAEINDEIVVESVCRPNNVKYISANLFFFLGTTTGFSRPSV
jgi:hypothetical protein